MTGEFKTGNYRIINKHSTGYLVYFYKVIYKEGRYVVRDLLSIPGEFMMRVDRDSSRPLTKALWERLEFWQ